MVRHRNGFALIGAERHEILGQQSFDVLRVVNDFVLATEVWKFTAYLMEAVRARRNDCFDFVAVQRFNHALRQRLVQVFIAHATCRVAVTRFFLSKNGEAHVGRLHDARERHSCFLRTIVKRSHAAHPEQQIHFFAACDHFRRRGDMHALGPAGAF